MLGSKLALSGLLLVCCWSCSDHSPPSSGTGTRACEVLAAVDGDTLRLRCDGAKVNARLACIDAPEMDQEPWGSDARRILADLAQRQVRIAGGKPDRWGRPVVEVQSATLASIGRELVERGAAAVYPRYCRDPEYLAAEARARTAGRGIWSTPGLHRTPWTWRRQRKDGKR